MREGYSTIDVAEQAAAWSRTTLLCNRVRGSGCPGKQSNTLNTSCMELHSVLTDLKPLTSLLSSKNLNRRLQGMALKLLFHDVNILYMKGLDNLLVG